jgi:two-component system chemotaxis response regulator CheB
MIRALVVEDSLTVRKHLVETLQSDPEIEVVGEAENGQQAVDECARLRPDVVTCDIVLPVLNGLQATERIMAWCPTPILIVSASMNRRDVFNTFDALAAGAVDVLDKPSEHEDGGAWRERFLSAVKLVSRIKVITHLRGRQSAPQQDAAAPPGAYELVAIGASTGGPAAVAELLGGLPRNFALPVLLVVHIGDPFGTVFAEWLNRQVPFEVRCARDGEKMPGPGVVLLAPPEHHLVLSRGRLRLTGTAPRHFCRPSVDVLFESVAAEMGARAMACLLTGMGRDGAAGLLAIKQAGGLTVAQDERSSVIFGMPQEAIKLGAAQHVLPLDSIASHLSAASGVVK